MFENCIGLCRLYVCNRFANASELNVNHIIAYIDPVISDTMNTCRFTSQHVHDFSSRHVLTPLGCVFSVVGAERERKTLCLVSGRKYNTTKVQAQSSVITSSHQWNVGLKVAQYRHRGKCVRACGGWLQVAAHQGNLLNFFKLILLRFFSNSLFRKMTLEIGLMTGQKYIELKM